MVAPPPRAAADNPRDIRIAAWSSGGEENPRITGLHPTIRWPKRKPFLRPIFLVAETSFEQNRQIAGQRPLISRDPAALLAPGPPIYRGPSSIWAVAPIQTMG